MRADSGPKIVDVTSCETGIAARHLAKVAARLFASRGYDATSVREIVEEAGVTKPTLYYHFGSKEGLAQALLTVPLTRLVESMRAALEGTPEAVEAVCTMMETCFAFSREDPDRSRFFFALFFGPMGQSLAAELSRFGEQIDGLWRQAARRLAEARVIATERVDACTSCLRGVFMIHMLDFLYRGKDLEPDLARRLVGDVLRGFGEPGPGRE